MLMHRKQNTYMYCITYHIFNGEVALLGHDQLLHEAEGHHHVDQRQDQGLKRPQGPWQCQNGAGKKWNGVETEGAIYVPSDYVKIGIKHCHFQW